MTILAMRPRRIAVCLALAFACRAMKSMPRSVIA